MAPGIRPGVGSSVVDPGSLPPRPWRNGGGTTRELRAGPGWRVSVADIDRAADYSTYAGWRRWSCVVRGAGLELTLDGARRDVVLGEVLSYPGDSAVHAAPASSEPVQNLNLMVETGAGDMALVPLTGARTLGPGVVAVWVLAGEVGTPDGTVPSGWAYLPEVAGTWQTTDDTDAEAIVLRLDPPDHGGQR